MKNQSSKLCPTPMAYAIGVVLSYAISGSVYAQHQTWWEKVKPAAAPAAEVMQESSVATVLPASASTEVVGVLDQQPILPPPPKEITAVLAAPRIQPSAPLARTPSLPVVALQNPEPALSTATPTDVSEKAPTSVDDSSAPPVIEAPSSSDSSVPAVSEPAAPEKGAAPVSPVERPSLTPSAPQGDAPPPDPTLVAPKSEEEAPPQAPPSPGALPTEDSLKDANADIPWIWVDLCLKDNEKCISGVPAKQDANQKWEIDVSDDDLRLLELDPNNFTFREDGEARWLTLDNAEYDESSLKITWSAGFDKLQDQGLTQGASDVRLDNFSRPLSLAINYSVAHSDATAAYADIALGKGHGALLSSYSWDSFNGEIKRGLTRFEYDQVSKGLRWTAGDLVMVSPDPLGAASLIQGVGVRRSFEQDPTQIIVARPRLTGIVERAGTLEVYSNGILISSQEVRPGPFNLEDLGISSGRQNIKLVLKDATGNRTTISSASYYGSSMLLAKGLTDYGASVGELYAPATDLTPNEEKQKVAQAYWRRGINDQLTLGARVDHGDQITSYGLTASTATPIGEFSLAAAQSSAGGQAFFGTYGYSSQLWSLGLSHWQQDDNYLLPTSMYDRDPRSQVSQRSSASVSFGFIPRVSLGLQASRTVYQNDVVEESKNVSLSGDVFKKVQWSLLYRDIQRTDQLEGEKAVSLLVSVPLGNQQHLSMTAENSDLGTSYGASYSKSRREELGLAYTANASQNANGDQNFNARADYQTQYGLYGIQADQFAGERNVTLNAQGSLVWAGRDILAGPPLGGAFAIINAPGAPHAPVLREATPVGKTNRRGSALIRAMTPYYPTQLGFNPEELSIDVATGNAISKKILPTPYTATVVKFDASQAQAIQAQLLWPDRIPIKYGSITFDDPINQTISLGGTGMLWLEQVPSGIYEGLVSTENGTARCQVVVPEVTEGIQDMGEVVCERLTGKAAQPEEQKPEEQKPQEQP